MPSDSCDREIRDLTRLVKGHENNSIADGPIIFNESFDRMIEDLSLNDKEED